MNNSRIHSTIILLVIIMMALAGCNLPQSTSKASPTIGVTQAFQTVAARLTQAALTTPAATLPASPTTAPPTLTPTVAASTPTPKPTSPPTNTSAPVSTCDMAGPGSPIDVTIPDKTPLLPGQTFTKTWRLQNVGTCTWTRDYSIALFSGESMGAPVSVPIPKQVAPGETVDISVDLKAPATAGTYQGNWKLRNASNVWFGIGPSAGSPFWVNIVVVSSGTITVTPGTTTPTPTPTVTSTTGSPGATPEVVSTGSRVLAPGDGANLDDRKLGSSGRDVAWDMAGSEMALGPQSGALIGIFGASQPNKAQCQAASLSAAPVPMSSMSKGLYLCIRTDKGYTGWIQLVDLNSTKLSLTIYWSLWSLP